MFDNAKHINDLDICHKKYILTSFFLYFITTLTAYHQKIRMLDSLV